MDDTSRRIRWNIQFGKKKQILLVFNIFYFFMIPVFTEKKFFFQQNVCVDRLVSTSNIFYTLVPHWVSRIGILISKHRHLIEFLLNTVKILNIKKFIIYVYSVYLYKYLFIELVI